jgi:hypothetical protein
MSSATVAPLMSWSLRRKLKSATGANWTASVLNFRSTMLPRNCSTISRLIAKRMTSFSSPGT